METHTHTYTHTLRICLISLVWCDQISLFTIVLTSRSEIIQDYANNI